MKTIYSLWSADCLACEEKPIMYLGYIKEDSRPKELLKSSFAKESFRVLVCPLLFVSH